MAELNTNENHIRRPSMTRRFLCAILLAFIFIASSAKAETYKRITVTLQTKKQFLDLHKFGMDIIEYGDNTLEIIALDDDLEWLDSQGIPYTVDIPDLKAYYRSQNKESLTMGGFKTLSEIEAYLDSLSAAYPTLMSPKFSIGTTIEGRDIWVVKVSDNFAVDEDEPEMLFVSEIHAREPAAAASLLNFMNYMLSNYGVDAEITDLIDNREMYFMAVQNPDGYFYNETTDPSGGGLWRKNRRDNGDATFGVDLNRNYDHNWGYDDMGSDPSTDGETYRGASPFSEPETQAYRDFVISRNFVIIHNFHTYGNLELWPPGYDRFSDPFEELFKNIGDSLTQFNGYDPIPGWALYPTNGAADDWCWYDSLSKPKILSFTCEIGPDFWPPPFQIPDLIAENVWPNLFLTRIADNPYAVGPPLAPVAAEPTEARGDFNLEWTLDDTLNPAVSFTINELSGKSTVIDDAEVNNGYWTTEKFLLSTNRAHSGVRSWHEIGENRAGHWLFGNYPYEVQENDSLKFWIWYEIEDGWDYFYVQVSTDGGFFFENLANDMTTNTSPQGLNLGNGITGTSGNEWVYAKFDLTPFAGQQIVIRLNYVTDWSYRDEGVYIDDFENVDFFEFDSIYAEGVTDTFYNFVEHPAGDYWYRIRAVDAQDQISHFSNLVHIDVPLGYLNGDANNDGNINILDLNVLINYIFRLGPAPVPFLGGDANCDGNVNTLDLNYLVNYIFRLGPVPFCP